MEELMRFYDNELGRLEASIEAESDEEFIKEYRNEIKYIQKIIKQLKNKKQ